MALEGFLQEFGLADILQLIYFQRKTGVLNIEGASDKIKVNFINGNITVLESKSRIEDKRLGKILVGKGLITQKDLENALKTHEAEGIRLGNILASGKLISEQVLTEIIEGQIIETIAQVFTWKEGRYEFVPQEVPVDRELSISLDTQHLLMGGIKIVDELSVIEGKLDLDTIYKKVKEPVPEQLNDVEREILKLIDGDTDVVTIINISPFEDFEVSKAVIALEEKGIIMPLVIQSAKKEPVRHPAGLKSMIYGAFLGTVLFLLLFIFKGNFDAYRVFEKAERGMRIERLKNSIDMYNAVNGRYPEKFEYLTEEKDPWGRLYVYKLMTDGFQLFSSGPDGVEGTEDDVY